MSTLVTTALRHNTSTSNNIILTSNGNVGVGISTPSTNLQVAGTSGSAQARFGTSTAGYVEVNAFDANPVYCVVGGSNHTAGVFGTQSNTPTIFFTNNTERMRIDASGRVTRPFQPMFMGYPTTEYPSGGMPTGVIAFTALYNNGNHFNSVNSRFTAPVTGWYRTTWGGLQLQPTVTSLQVNGVRTYNGNHWAGTGPSYINMTQTVLRSLNAGDYLTVEGWNGGGYYGIGWFLWSVELVS